VSTASTIPPEIISYDDDDFLDEIDRVNDLFFGNVDLHSTDRHRDFETNENNLDESDDDEQLAENNDNSNTSSEFSVEVSDTNVKRNRKHSQILKKKRGCVRLYANYGLSEFKTIWLEPCAHKTLS